MRLRRVLPSIAAVLSLALAGLIAAPPVPARADPPRDHYDRGHYDRDHDRRPPPRHYYRPVVPAPVYAPPAVVYQPPPVSPGINLIIPFNIR